MNSKLAHQNSVDNLWRDVVVVGAGFAGLYSLHKLRELSYRVIVLEAGSDIGGTWFWNRYPGARCDIESLQYSYSFSEEIQQEWQWTELYGTQPEILRYIHFVADRLNLRPDIQLNTRVTAMRFDESDNTWTVNCDSGEQFVSRHCIMATGCLSAPIEPDITGLNQFSGELYRTTNWPTESVNFPGKTVGLIGTGATGVQLAPVVAEQCGQLLVFQRTPNFSIPAHNRPINDGYEQNWKANYAQHRINASKTRNNAIMYHGTEPGENMPLPRLQEIFEKRWQMGGLNFLYGVTDLVTSQRVNDAAAQFVCDKIAALVKNQETARKLMPKGQVIGAKRLCADTHYYETFNRDNVRLIDLTEEPLETITKTGVNTEGSGGKNHYPLDVLILATGFDAMTGALNRIDITGLGGTNLRDYWAAGARTLLGMTVADMPNLFIITGPGSPSVLSNMVTSIEQNVDWIADCIEHMHEHGFQRISATAKAEQEWMEHVQAVAQRTLLPSQKTWYVGANVPGKAAVYLPYIGGVTQYLEHCRDVATNGYEGLSLQ
ncbi:MAG: NAD(P)/FAD-dependent oxidoreductase [Burkholderiaceae bacterium]